MMTGVGRVETRLLQSPMTPTQHEGRGRHHEEPMEEETMTTDSTVSLRPSWQEDWTSSDNSQRRERTEPEPKQSPGKEVRPARGLKQTLKKSVAGALAVMDKVKALAT